MDGGIETPEGESTEQQTVRLLEAILAALVGLRADLNTERSNLDTITLDQLAATEGIAITLDTFLADWIAANTPSPGPAVSVILKWGPPQPIPKGPN